MIIVIRIDYSQGYLPLNFTTLYILINVIV
jgi:hypothetical protein